MWIELYGYIFVFQKLTKKQKLQWYIVTQSQLQIKEGRHIAVDKTLSLILGIINELHVTAVKWVGKQNVYLHLKSTPHLFMLAQYIQKKILLRILVQRFSYFCMVKQNALQISMQNTQNNCSD